MREVWANSIETGVQVDPAAMLDVLAASHRQRVRVDVVFGREVILEDLAITNGFIEWDRHAATLARCTIDLAEPALLPTEGGPLSPFGYELRVARGVVAPNGDDWLCYLGVFPIQQSRADGVSLLTSVTAMDRSQLVRDARFEDDYAVAAGTNYATAIRELIEDGVTGLTYLLPDTDETTPALVFNAQTDRWEAAQKMAQALGWELYFDGLGRCVAREEPSPTAAAADFTLAEGDGGALTALVVNLDRTPAYNRVIATSSNASAGTVYRGVWTDDDPASPTYYDGPFGRKPRFYASPFIGSDAQAESAARAIGVANIGIARSLEFASVPNPMIEPGDACLVRREALGVDEIQLVDSGLVGLSPEIPMALRSRARQLAEEVSA